MGTSNKPIFFNLKFFIDFFCMKLKLFFKESYQLHLLLPLHHQD